jgi:Zn-dependent protease/predicted transcriptional regulator
MSVRLSNGADPTTDETRVQGDDMFGHAWRLGRIAGIEIRVDPSWTVIALLVAYSLFLQFTLVYPSLSDAAGVALGVSATVLFFGSVLVHEMTHALLARRAGIPVRDITLFIFGGATHANVESHGPRDEFVVSIVGPLSSVVLGGLFWGASILGRGVLPHPVEGALGYLGWINLLLAVFNFLPGFPLDGGRVLRSAVWGVTHDLRRATRIATVAGEAIGYLLVGGGALLVFGGALITGVWFAAIGWFLAQTARVSYGDFEAREAMRGVDVGVVMERGLLSVPGGATVQEAVNDYLFRREQDVFPVDQDGSTVGIITGRLAQAVPRNEWATRPVRDAMVPLEKLDIVQPQASMDAVLARLEEDGKSFALVLDDGHAVGLLTLADVARWIRRRDALAA